MALPNLDVLQHNLNVAIDRVRESPDNLNLNQLDIYTDEMIQYSIAVRKELRKHDALSTRTATPAPRPR